MQLDDKSPVAAACATHSFAPDTRVLMADGTTRPIEEVNLGDEVATTDPQTGEHSDQQVTLLHANRDTELTDVTVSTAPAAADRAAKVATEGKGGRSTRGPTESTLETTAHHPFWDATTGEWVDAAELTPGTSTLVGPDGQLQYVTAVRNFTGAEVMRDLTVATTHTYYVLAGDFAVLVHNCGEDFNPTMNDGPIGPMQLSSRGKLVPPGVSRLPSGRLPANFEYAGREYDGDGWTDAMRQEYPAGVRFSHEGFPDFSAHASHTVTFTGEYAGNTTTDFTNADRMAGLTGNRPRGWTWHHHEDKRTMQLIPTNLHDAVRHAGGRALLRR